MTAPAPEPGRPGPPSPAARPLASPPLQLPSATPGNPFARVRLRGPLSPVVAEGLLRLGGGREAESPAPPVQQPPEGPPAAAPLAARAPRGATIARSLEPTPEPVGAAARPFFIEGELESFVLRPITRRNFIGVGGGVASIPNDANTLLNTFFVTVEPQIDIINEVYHWKLGLGAPLNLKLLDTRGPFEGCIEQGRTARLTGGDQDTVAAVTGACLLEQKDNLTEGIGTLRKEDWDQPSDFAKVIRYFIVGEAEHEFYLNVSRQFDQSLSHGTAVRDYNANINFNTSRLGATIDFNKAAIGIQGIANDLVRPDVLGMMLFIRPFRPYSDSVFLRSLSLGLSFVHGVNQPRRLLFEPGLFAPAFDQPIVKVDEQLTMLGAAYAPMDILGVDLEAKIVRGKENDLKVYADFQKMKDFGEGVTLGALFRYSHGEPATQALRARAELNVFSADYLPSYFDTYHDIFQYQYLPATYRASNGLLYSPTKWQYLEAARGGRPKMGAYVEVAHAFLDKLTLSLAGRMWRPVGSPSRPGFDGLRFPDYGQGCEAEGDGDLACGDETVRIDELSYSSLRVRAELPFRKFLQAFASYEVFSSGDEPGLGALQLDGDNEVLFGGARLMLLPFLFFQAETRRYFFLQRVTNIDLQTLTVEQDQRYHANWTFAFSTYLGYEF